MSDYCRHEAADSVCKDGFRCEFAIAERVKHGGVGGEIAAPAHADCSEYGYGVAVGPALGDEVGHKAQGSAYGAECRDREGYEVGIMKSEEPFKHEVDF